MSRYFTSALLAGVTAAVIWLGITIMLGFDTMTIGLWTLILLAGTTLIAFGIAAAVGRGAAGGAPVGPGVGERR